MSIASQPVSAKNSSTVNNTSNYSAGPAIHSDNQSNQSNYPDTHSTNTKSQPTNTNYTNSSTHLVTPANSSSSNGIKGDINGKGNGNSLSSTVPLAPYLKSATANTSANHPNSSGAPKSQTVDSNFPNFYMSHRENSSNLPFGNPQDQSNISRPRGDSIFLPPPINSASFKFGNNDYDPNSAAAAAAAAAAAGSGTANPGSSFPLSGGPSRSNSIFSSLIQIPGSNGNSVSGPSSTFNNNPSKQPQPPSLLQNNPNNNSAGGTNNNNINNNTNNSTPNNNSTTAQPGGQRLRQLSFLPPGGQGNNDYSTMSSQDLENYFGKESLGNLLSWNQQRQSQSQQPQQISNQPQSQSKKSRGSLDMNTNSFWEGLNSGLSGSVSGLPITNDSLNGILAGLSNGGIDFSGMSNEQRRDSILKIINDPQFQQQRAPSTVSAPSMTRLREDIFDKSKQSPGTAIAGGINPNSATPGQQTGNAQNKYGGVTLGRNAGVAGVDRTAGGAGARKGNLAVPSSDKNNHLSPTSSMSSKSSAKYDEPQSPKTSPSIFNARVLQTRAPPLQANPSQGATQSIFAQRPQSQQQQQQQPQQQQQQPGYYQNYGPNPYNYGNYPNQAAGGYAPHLQPSYQSPYQQQAQQYNQHGQPIGGQYPGNFMKPGQSNYYGQADRQNYSYQPLNQQKPGLTPQQQQQQGQQQSQQQGSPSIQSQQQASQQGSPYVAPANTAKPRARGASRGGRPSKKSRTTGAANTASANNGAKNPAAVTPQSISTNPTDKNLVPAQQYVKSEDGRPLLGATKVDQLMLVIQAREKGNTNTIQQGIDGDILGSPGNRNSVLPQPVNLVGGVDKPAKTTGEASQSPDDSKKGGRKHKTQQCPYCLKYFNQSTHLEVHIRSHIGHKPFECSYCHKRFTQGGNLRTHLRLHTGEKPFTCEVCKRSFSRKGNLAAHQLTHNNEKPFECKLDNCDKSFTQLGNLKSHQNRFHLPTLNKLTQDLAELSGDAIANLPAHERELLDYFRDLYKNSNKGIRGRGKVHKEEGEPGASASPEATSISPPQGQHPQQTTKQQLNQPVNFMSNNNVNRNPNYQM